MKKLVFSLILAGCILAPARGEAADEKIDPSAYICAELIASAVDGVPPIYEGLQLDGYVSSLIGQPVADPEALHPLVMGVFEACTAEPTDKAFERWRETRESYPINTEGPWRADKTVCADYAKDPDNGSGFVIWLDAYNRGKNGTDKSILTDQATLDSFLEYCAANPDALMLDAVNAKAK